MSKTYHLDCASGIAGDMFLGACLDLGMPVEVLADAVARLGLPGVGVHHHKAARGGVTGTRFQVSEHGRLLEEPEPGHHHHDHGHHHHHGHSHSHGPSRDLAGIRRLLHQSTLAPAVKERALALFERLGAAEAKVHGVPLDRVHFHEVGAVDSIVDLVGAAAAVEFLAPERITASPVNVGGGRVRTAHGELSVPAPATAELLAGIPIFGGGTTELTTPTGALLLAELVDEFGDLPALVLDAGGIGYGLGRKELSTHPNVLRLLRGERPVTREEAGTEVTVVECEVDDLPGEGFGFVLERLLAEGALDVYFTPVQMKKNRPGTLVTLLCRRPDLERLAGVLLSESGSLGCRYYAAARLEAEREIAEVQTVFGPVRVKRSRLAGRPLASAPEFEDCRRLALESGVPWREVYRAALAASA